MSRIDINQVMIETAIIFSKRSTCARVKAGAVIAIDRHIVSTGYNGNASGKIHCEDYFKELFKSLYESESDIMFEDWKKSDQFKELHHKWAIINELHAEMNAIIYAARKGIKIYGGSIYTTHSPCIFCTKAIVHSGIKEVYYRYLYDNQEAEDSINYLLNNGISVIKI